MSQGFCSQHNFVVFEHAKTGKQVFYAFGDNLYQQQGYKSKDVRNQYNLAPLKIPALNKFFETYKLYKLQQVQIIHCF